MKPTRPLIAIDTETGGLFPSINPLLSISIVPSWTMEPVTFYIEPLAMEVIRPEAAALNGYSHDLWMERGALPMGQSMQRFHKVLSDCLAAHPDALILAHNAGFDRSFLDEAYRVSDYQMPHRHHWRCSMQMMAQLMDQGLIPQGSLGLDRLGEISSQWPVGGRPSVHEAHEDALACLIGYQWLQQRLSNALDQASSIPL